MQPRLPVAAGIAAVCAFVGFVGPWAPERAVSAPAPLTRQARLVADDRPAADTTATDPDATPTPSARPATPDEAPTPATGPSPAATSTGTDGTEGTDGTHGTAGTDGPSPSESATQPADDSSAGPGTETRADRRPNIVLITSDDQAEYDMRWMPKTRRLLGRAGVTFTDSVSPHPLCCPARAEILTGQFAQNNGVRTNKGLHGGYGALHTKQQTIGSWLRTAGYRTMFTGKFLNMYRGGHVPGWDEWHPFVGAGVYRYYDYQVSHNGDVRWYHDLHQADFLARQTVRSLRQFATDDRPFFVWQSHVAPHGACVPLDETGCWTLPVPARRHQGTLGGFRPPSFTHPAYDEADVSDKPSLLSDLHLGSRRRIAALFQARIEALQSVDEAVARTVRTLRDLGELQNTLILFTSDNGYLLGEHRYTGKVMPYERSLQVPLLMRGPGVPQGIRRHQQVATIDLAPTFLDAAGAEATLPMDGRSLLPLGRSARARGYDTLLIQAGPQTPEDYDFGGWFYRGVRTARYTYAHYPRYGVELYDRLLDPHQLRSVAGEPAYRRVEAELARRTRVLEGCSGGSCRARFGPLPRPKA
jgi:N-acetylglucosamine-6-sulfatase